MFGYMTTFVKKFRSLVQDVSPPTPLGLVVSLPGIGGNFLTMFCVLEFV